MHTFAVKLARIGEVKVKADYVNPGAEWVVFGKQKRSPGPAEIVAVWPAGHVMSVVREGAIETGA